MFKSCAPLTDCVSKINNALVDNANDIGVVRPMYNLMEYSDNYSKRVNQITCHMCSCASCAPYPMCLCDSLCYVIFSLF